MDWIALMVRMDGFMAGMVIMAELASHNNHISHIASCLIIFNTALITVTFILSKGLSQLFMLF